MRWRSNRRRRRVSPVTSSRKPRGLKKARRAKRTLRRSRSTSSTAHSRRRRATRAALACTGRPAAIRFMYSAALRGTMRLGKARSHCLILPRPSDAHCRPRLRNIGFPSMAVCASRAGWTLSRRIFRNAGYRWRGWNRRRLRICSNKCSNVRRICTRRIYFFRSDARLPGRRRQARARLQDSRVQPSSGAGIQPDWARIQEGSGLARANLVTPAATVALLQYMNRHSAARIFKEALPVAGVDGTLKNRMKNTAAQNNARAKTGTLQYVYALSGYVTTAAKERLAFSIMLNHYAP